MDYEAVIGLETHVQLKTKSKMWRGPENGMSVKVKKDVCVLLGVLLCAVTCLQTGCRPNQNTASQSETFSTSNSRLQAALESVSNLAFEPDPAKRPLVLSQSATNRREWALKALQQGYRSTERTSARWDAQVQQAFEAFSDYTRGSGTNWPVLKKALANTKSAGCDDPMIQYMRVRHLDETQSNDDGALKLLRAHDAMLRSEYHPVFKFFAGLRAVQSTRTADKKTVRSTRVIWTTVSLEDLARDTNAPADEVYEAVALWLDHTRSKGWVDYVTEDLEPILERSWGQTERWFRYRSRTEIGRAWGERGGGYADKVTEEGWRGYKEYLDKAEGFLTKAWQMNSNNAETALLMMRLELAQGSGRSRMETWFNRAMSMDTNFYDAASLMTFYLEPRWYGSDTTALAFARLCVASDKWGGQVPLVLADLHQSLATYYNLSNSPAYWHREHVWPDIKSSYEKFFGLRPEAVGWRHDYARDAYNCGQYSVFLEQTKLFADGTNYAFFGGKDKFHDMIEKAGSASGRSTR